MKSPHSVKFNFTNQEFEFSLDIRCEEYRSAAELADVISSALREGERVDYSKLNGIIEVTFHDDDGLNDFFASRRRERRDFEVLKAIRSQLVHPTYLASSISAEISRFHLYRADLLIASEANRLQSNNASQRIVMPPGMRLSTFLQALLGFTRFRRYVAPAIADMQEEYFEALNRGDKWNARAAVVRGYVFIVPGWLWSMAATALAKFSREN